jgi:hypothetical protein
VPHCKCVTCKARMHVSGGPAGLAGQRCPRCDSPLESVANLEELLGYPTIELCEDDALAAAAVALPLSPTPAVN